jgi:hypothetical protein
MAATNPMRLAMALLSLILKLIQSLPNVYFELILLYIS